MNKLTEFLSQQVQLPLFQKGVSHDQFNDIINTINGAIQAAQQDANTDPLKGFELRPFYIAENGESTNCYLIWCQKIPDPQA